MEKKLCMMDRLGGLVLGTAFVTVGALFMALGVTFLPVIGVVIAIPLIGISVYFFRPQVQVMTAGESVPAVAYKGEHEEHEEGERKLDEAA
ncbi:MAG: hypothetical protein ACLFVT_01775 [Syntrophobacteria bacterium]